MTTSDAIEQQMLDARRAGANAAAVVMTGADEAAKNAALAAAAAALRARQDELLAANAREPRRYGGPGTSTAPSSTG